MTPTIGSYEPDRTNPAVNLLQQGCGEERSPFSFLESYERDLVLAVNSTTLFTNALNTVDQDQLQEYCGTGFQAEMDLLVEVEGIMKVLLTDLKKGVELVSCESIHSLYSRTFHEGTCIQAVNGLAWIFSSLLIISFFGMLIITFRSALYDVVWHDEFGEGEEEEQQQQEEVQFEDESIIPKSVDIPPMLDEWVSGVSKIKHRSKRFGGKKEEEQEEDDTAYSLTPENKTQGNETAFNFSP